MIRRRRFRLCVAERARTQPVTFAFENAFHLSSAEPKGFIVIWLLRTMRRLIRLGNINTQLYDSSLQFRFDIVGPNTRLD